MIKIMQINFSWPGQILLAICLFMCFGQLFGQSSVTPKIWVGTWTTAEQLVESSNMPPSPGLTNNSLRQIVRVSIGGDTLRLRFCNIFSTASVTMKSVQIALSTGKGTINSSTNKFLTFNGSNQVTMNAGAIIASDPIAFHLAPRADVAITINYGSTSSSVTGHPGSRTTSYLLAGSSTATTSFANAATAEHWYNIFAIDVRAASSSSSVAILGNSITDGRGSTTDLQNRWPDILSARLVANPSTEQIGILNLGIGGNCVLKDCLGPSGVSRFQRDILDQPGVRMAIIAEAVNDIGGVTSSGAATSMTNSIIAAYTKMINDAHAKNIKICGATIMPFKGNSYYNTSSEQCRNAVNKWIRTSGKFDCVIDFDRIMRSTSDTAKMGSATNQNDGLHPDADGYKKMGESIDLNLFKGLTNSIVTGLSDDWENSETSGLSQNYPNPFTDKTTIAFELEQTSYVSLKVYSALGVEIAELAGQNYYAGRHTIELDGTHLSKGMGFYTIKTNSYSSTRKMIFQGR
jgi:lysophospholipase L1-like esterase